MTPHQEQAIERIKRAAIERVGTLRAVEIKEFTSRPLDERSNRLWVVITAGYVDDESTMLSVLGRVHGCFLVGPRGKIESGESFAEQDRQKLANMKRYPLIYGWRG